MLKAILTAIQIFTREGDENYTVLFQHPDFIVVKIVTNKTLVIFYGTDSLMEWVDNFRFGMLNTEGFPLGWHNCAISSFQIIKELNFKPDYVLGYSRGGAIALIYSYYFNIQAIAFNSPKVNKNLLYWTKKPILIGCLNDPVKFVPLGYNYPGAYTAVYLNAGGHFWQKEKYTNEVKINLIEHNA